MILFAESGIKKKQKKTAKKPVSSLTEQRSSKESLDELPGATGLKERWRQREEGKL